LAADGYHLHHSLRDITCHCRVSYSAFHTKPEFTHITPPPYRVVYIHLSNISISMTPSTIAVMSPNHPPTYNRNRKRETAFHAAINTIGVGLTFPTLGVSLLASMVTSLLVDGCINAYDNSFDTI